MPLMREDVLGEVLLVKAIEETDRNGELLPLSDREHATRDELRPSGEPGSTLDETAAARGPRVMRLRGARAELLFGPLAQRYPVFRDILERSRPPGWLTVLVLAGTLACGVVLASLDGTRRINILAFPFLGVIAWNLVVYFLLATHAVRRLVRSPPATRAMPRWTGRAIARRLAGLVDQTSRVHAKLGEVVSRYAADWAQVGGPLLAAHTRRLFHLGAASLALGMIAGLYLRGVVFRYEAGWESTFLGPRAVRDVLRLVFGAASAISGIALPQTDEAVSALRWTQGGGGGEAAPWIHLIAVTLALSVIGPRLVLAGLARVDAWRWRSAKHLPDTLLAYARSALGAVHAGHGCGGVIVLPYAFDLPAESRGALQRWLESSFGRGARLDLRAMSPYGEEDGLRAKLETSLPATAEALVLLMSLAATPESENHGRVILAARDAARRARPERELRVVIEESAYASRLARDASLAGRVEERRNLWRGFVGGYGLEAAFVDLAGSA